MYPQHLLLLSLSCEEDMRWYAPIEPVVEDMAEVAVVTEDGNDPVVEDKQEDAMSGQQTLLNFAGQQDGGS